MSASDKSQSLESSGNQTMKKKLATAMQAIEELFSDTSVGPEKTLAALEELRSEITMKMEALKEDLKREP